MLVFRMLCRITQSSDTHRTEAEACIKTYLLLLSREVNRETGNPVYRFQTGNRFAKRTTGCRIFVNDFDGLLRIRNCACCIKITHLFKVSLQIKLTLIENIQPRK